MRIHQMASYYFRSKEGSLFTASKFIFKNSFSLLETRTPVLQVLKGTNMAILLQFYWEVQLINDRQIFIAWLSIMRWRKKNTPLLGPTLKGTTNNLKFMQHNHLNILVSKFYNFINFLKHTRLNFFSGRAR